MWPCGLKPSSQETFGFHNQWKWLLFFSLFCTSSRHPGRDQRNFITLEMILAYRSPLYRSSTVEGDRFDFFFKGITDCIFSLSDNLPVHFLQYQILIGYTFLELQFLKGYNLPLFHDFETKTPNFITLGRHGHY